MLGALSVLTSHEAGDQRGALPSRNSPCLGAKPWEHPSCHWLCALVSPEHGGENTKTPSGSNGLIIPALPGVWHQHMPLCHRFGVAELPHEAGPDSQAVGSLFVWCQCQQRPAGSLFAILGHVRLFPAWSCCGIFWAAPELPCPWAGRYFTEQKHLAWTQVLPVLSLVIVTRPHCPQCSWLSLPLPCKVLHHSILSVPQDLPAFPGFYCPAQDFGSEKNYCTIFLDSFFLPQPV